MGKLVPFSETHIVSVAEATAPLFGALIPRVGWRWFASADWPAIPLDPTPWVIETMEVGMTNASGAELEGRVISLFGVWPKGMGVSELPSTATYLFGCRVKLLRPCPVLWGVGLYLRGPAHVATDIITVNVVARVGE